MLVVEYDWATNGIPRQCDRDVGEEGESVKRIDASKSYPHEAPIRWQVDMALKCLSIDVGNHKATQHEEHIDPEIGLIKKSRLVNERRLTAKRSKMKHDNHDRGDSAQRRQAREVMRFGRISRPHRIRVRKRINRCNPSGAYVKPWGTPELSEVRKGMVSYHHSHPQQEQRIWLT